MNTANTTTRRLAVKTTLALLALTLLAPLACAAGAEPGGLKVPRPPEMFAEGAVQMLDDVTVVKNQADRSISFLHEPTGVEVCADVPGEAQITRLRAMDPDAIADGTDIRFWGRITPQTHTIKGDARIFPDGDKETKAYTPGDTTIGGKLYREPLSEPQPNNGWTTLDGKSCFVLQTPDGARWHPQSTGRPAVKAAEPGSASDFQPGRNARVTLKRGKGNWQITQAVIDVWPSGSDSLFGLGRSRGLGASGVSAGQYRKQLDAVLDQLKGMKSELDRLMPVSMTVAPELVLPGEPVRLHIRALSTAAPATKAMLYSDYFHNGMNDPQPIDLNWKPAGDQDGLTVYTAEVSLPSGKVGQYRVEWKPGIGGDIDLYSRSYAVCDKQSAVCMFLITSGGKPAPSDDFHRLHLPFDYWFNILEMKAWEHAAPSTIADASREARQYGSVPNFGLQHFPWGTAQTCMEPPDLQNLQVQTLKELVPKFGFESTDIACRSYTMGNVSYRMLQNEGGFSVSSLCTESHIDESMGINHWGKPERPYFMSSDDFRKPGPGGPDGTVAFSQVQRHTYLARHYMCDFCIEPGNGAFREAGGRKEFDAVYFSRILDFYNGLLEMPRCQDGPFFIQQGIEFNGERPGATEGNRLILEYAAQKAAAGNVVFATTRGVAAFYKRHYNETPESTCYFQDYWAGVMKWLKPVSLEDSMSLENAQLYALALRGQILPEDLYDYTSKWDFPDFGNEEMPRRPGDPSAYLRPGTFDKFAATPRIVDTRKFKVERADAESGKSLAITVSVEAAEAHRGLALALWDIPREFQRGTDWFNASSGARFVPVLAPYTDNLNGFLIVNVKPGANRFTLQINSPARTLQSQDVKIGDSLEGKVFTRDGTTMAYVWSSLPWSSSLVLTLPEGKSATVYVAPQGIRQECRAGANRFDIPQGQWLRVTGLTREELRESAEQGKPDSH